MLAGLLRSSIDLVPWRLRTKVRQWPIIGPLQRWLIGRFLSKVEFLHTIDAGPAKGLRYWIRLPDDKAVWVGTYEVEFATALAATIRRNDVCLDIGGYCGFFSGVCALAGAREVHICEPLPANICRIRRLIAANPGLPLQLHEIAAGKRREIGDFRIMPEDSMGKLSSSQFQERQTGKEIIRVRIETLDHLIQSGAIPKPNVIKIDVEGAEAMVLKGAEQMLINNPSRVFIEIHSRRLARDCCASLAGFGYSIQVLETNRSPDFQSEPEICHFVALPS